MAIKSVVRHVRFTPQVIDELFADDVDYHGLIFWYNDAKDAADQMKESFKKK